MQGNYTKYLVRAIEPQMRKWTRNLASFGHSAAFAATNFNQFAYIYLGEGHVMARKSRSKFGSTTDASKSPKISTVWANYKLTQDDVAIVVSDATEHEKIASRLATLFALGADFSVRHNPERKNFSAFAISLPGADDGVRVGISAFGGDVWQAIAAVLYKCDLYANAPEKFTESGQGLGIG